MDKATFTERLQAIGTEEDDVKRRGLIADLITEGGADYDDHAAAVADRDAALANLKEAQEENMRLFKQVGVREEPEDPPEPKPEPKRKFEDLFNDKGGIK